MTSFREAISGLRSDVRALRSEVREDIRELRTEVRDDLEKLSQEVGKMKANQDRGKGWVAGALAVLALLSSLAKWILPVALLALAGCAAGPYGAESYWHDRQRPVKVFVDETMRPECIAATLDALDFWRDTGVDYLRYRRASDAWSGFYGPRGPVGTISITERTLPPGPLGAALDVGIRRRIRWGRIRLARDARDSCSVSVIAHEIGHALGLEHSPAGLMFWIDQDDMSLTQDEIDWVTQ